MKTYSRLELTRFQYQIFPTPTPKLQRQCFLFLTLQKQKVSIPDCQAHEKIIYLHSGPVLGPPGPGSQAISPEGDFLPLLTSTSALAFQSISHYLLKFPSFGSHRYDG